MSACSPFLFPSGRDVVVDLPVADAVVPACVIDLIGVFRYLSVARRSYHAACTVYMVVMTMSYQCDAVPAPYYRADCVYSPPRQFQILTAVGGRACMFLSVVRLLGRC